MMKLFSSLLTSIAILSCSTVLDFVGANTLDGDAQLQILVGLETRLDHNEMNRIFSTPNHHRHLKADKVALAAKAKAHIGTCLQLYHSSIDDHNKSNDDGGGLELIPFSKDGSRFYLTGSVNDFTSYLKNNGGDDVGFFISFEETTDKQKQVTIAAKYEDGQSAKKFSKELAECNGFVGTFHRRNRKVDQVEISKNAYDEKESRKLNPTTPNNAISAVCPSIYNGTENPEINPDFPAASAGIIRNIYGVPTLDGACYSPRDSAVFEELGESIGANDLACYNQNFDLQNTMVKPVLIENSPLAEWPSNTPNGICQLPDCVCANGVYAEGGVSCGEANLDVQMLSAMSGGTTIRSISYNIGAIVPAYENLMIQLTKLDEHDELPAVISSSYTQGCIDFTDTDTVNSYVEICNHIGLLAINGLTFFLASGDGGATDGVCGIYCQEGLAGCPYVTAVGGSFGSTAGSEVLSTNIDQGVNVISAGGFSKLFTEENGFNLTYQKTAVEAWRNQQNSSMSLPGYTLADGSVGAGFPDVSLKSDNIESVGGFSNQISGGTSASSPLFAGIVNLCASQLDDDVAGFGWINPLLYQNPGLFFDIIGGNNQYFRQDGGPTGVFSQPCPISPTVETCPVDATVLVAYLNYDGSFGEEILLEANCIINGTNTAAYIDRTITSGESFSVGPDVVSGDGNTPCSEFALTFSDNNGGVVKENKISTACPGPWTLNSELLTAFTIEGFLSTDDLNDSVEGSSLGPNITANGKYFGFEALVGWDPASGLGTLGTTDPDDPNKGFQGLCQILLDEPFDFDKINCKSSKKSKKSLKKKKKNSKQKQKQKR